MTGWKRIAYSIACVVVPSAWGLLVVFISNRIDRKTRSANALADADKREDEPIHIEYHL